MCKTLEQFSDKIKGSFSFFDRMIINGYLTPLTNEHSSASALCQLGVLYKDFKPYFTSVTESIAKQVEDSAKKLGRPVTYLRPQKIARKTLHGESWRNPRLTAG